MASPERPGYIYLMRLEEAINPWECAHKIGRSVDPDIRARQIGLILPYDTVVLHSFWVNDMRHYEQLLHEELSTYHLQGEWFWPDRQWVNWFRSLNQFYLDTGEYPQHEPYPQAQRS